MGNWILTRILCGVVFVCFVSCAGKSVRWEEVHSTDTIEAYEEFLRNQPKGEFAEKARQRIMELYYDQACAEDTIEAYEEFLRAQPKGEFAEKARQRIMELYYDQAGAENTAQAYRDFLIRYPKTAYTSKIQSRIEELDFANAQLIGTTEAYREFLNYHPNGRFSAEVRARLDNPYFRIEKILLVPWDALADCRIREIETVNNRMRVYVEKADDMQLRYVICPLDQGDSLTLATPEMDKFEADQQFNHEIVRVEKVSGLLDDGIPDDNFYSPLGIGSYLRLETDKWIEVCGVVAKGGAFKVVRTGLEFQAGTMLKDINISTSNSGISSAPH